MLYVNFFVNLFQNGISHIQPIFVAILVFMAAIKVNLKNRPLHLGIFFGEKQFYFWPHKEGGQPLNESSSL